VRQRVVAQVEAGLLWEQPAAVAERLEPELDAAWRREARDLASRAIDTSREGGLGAKGWPEVLDSLTQHRVRHLVFAHGASPALEGLPRYVMRRWATQPASFWSSDRSSRRSHRAPR
jgi:hypothetical protein